ncbi:hypothetical protein MGYG_09080 [Nannizzia gypsea CBS 118893]|uniref:Uncharacterized protein n=1 Tax=Arthroderma gypseum (strain ATCC MYA-4604 / CBS 118893) TaxID=535722 RepID=E4UVL7_ARTGP|nr:hypothetical protein MGYG_09080 [Nannizzia gypsea CBS 118893]EFR02344.1 hypothetical protein MGYG_09080 [Nannizzia gypsea CBS 118893]
MGVVATGPRVSAKGRASLEYTSGRAEKTREGTGVGIRVGRTTKGTPWRIRATRRAGEGATGRGVWSAAGPERASTRERKAARRTLNSEGGTGVETEREDKGESRKGEETPDSTGETIKGEETTDSTGEETKGEETTEETGDKIKGEEKAEETGDKIKGEEAAEETGDKMKGEEATEETGEGEGGVAGSSIATGSITTLGAAHATVRRTRRRGTQQRTTGAKLTFLAFRERAMAPVRELTSRWPRKYRKARKLTDRMKNMANSNNETLRSVEGG